MLRRLRAIAGFILVTLLVSGCGGLVSSAAGRFADNLGDAVLNQPDPEIVRDGMPAYLLLLDSFIEGSPEDPALLAAAAEIYAAYGAVFVREEVRADILTARALSYAERAVCQSFERGCDWPNATYEDFELSVADLDDDHAAVATTYAVASLAYIRAHSDDWGALARLPHIEVLLNKVVPFTADEDLGTLYSYLGVLNTLRPPALGGQPEVGRDYFEKAITLSGGQDLSVKVEYARGYARLLYEQELHDRLLREVLAAPVEADGYTLTNTLAKQDAQALLASGADYF